MNNGENVKKCWRCERSYRSTYNTRYELCEDCWYTLKDFIIGTVAVVLFIAWSGIPLWTVKMWIIPGDLSGAELYVTLALVGIFVSFLWGVFSFVVLMCLMGLGEWAVDRIKYLYREGWLNFLKNDNPSDRDK